jgi:hypothetical protein
MKKSVLMSILFLTFLVSAQLILAASNSSSNITVDDLEDDDAKVDLAYTCLSDLIEEKNCEDLSLAEMTFAVIATGDCASELMAESKNDECWPDSSCKVKETAQAMIALDRIDSSTEDTQEWLLTQNQSTDNLQWFLQIEGNDAMSCSIVYSDTSYTVELDEDKAFSSGAGSCLSIDFSNYWLMISSSCYDEEFEISCDKSFQTNLIYRKSDSSVFFISEDTTSSPAAGTNTEKVESQCFKKDGSCDYESTLWASYALVSASADAYDVSPFWPYLQTMAEENELVIPEGILNYISGSATFKTELFGKQESDGYWDVSGDKFYDTAFALMPYGGDSSSEKSKSIQWLLTPGVQDDDGCWKGNLLNTAFLLYSIWPREVSSSSPSNLDCSDAGFYCLSPIDCSSALGSKLSGYSCSVASTICCNKPAISNTCSELNGLVCNSNQNCEGGISEDSSDLGTGETCCVGGTCVLIEDETNVCEESSGVCVLSTYGCASNEEESALDCGTSNKVCCTKKGTDDESSSAWIWIIFLLFLLIVLIVLGIIYRDKLRPYWLQLKSKFNKRGSNPQGNFRGPGLPSSPSSSLPLRTQMNRRFFPPQNIPQQQVRPNPESVPQVQRPKPVSAQPSSVQKPTPQPNEMDDVLRKLKEMSK